MDIKLSFVEKGFGDVMVLLHGNNESGEYFEHQIDYFSEKYRVIAVDTRGHGKSPRGRKSFTLEQFADDLKDFFEEMIIDSAVVLGFSDGANIALLFALKYPQFVTRLILNGADLNPSGVRFKYQFPIVMEYILFSILDLFDNKYHRRREMLSLMVNQPDIKPHELSKINVPTLVIAGTDDMISEDHTVLIRNNIRNCQIAFVKGTHFVARDNPTDFNKAVSEFLNS